MPQPNDEPESQAAVQLPSSAQPDARSSTEPSLQSSIQHRQPVPINREHDRQTELSDESLMHKVQSGSSSALQQLIERYAQALLTFLTRLLGNRDDADDLLQESLMSLWNRRATYEYPRPFRPWIFTIAANKGRELLRNKTRQLIRTSGEDEMANAIHQHSLYQHGANQSPLEQVLKQETNQAVLNATQSLPQQQRAVLSLRIWNELSYAEIAEVLQSTESTVRSHMFHALKNLRLSLAGGGNHE